MGNLEILRSDKVLVRKMQLDLNAESEAHFHKEITDSVFPLTGEIMVKKFDPLEEIVIGPGEFVAIEPQRIHQIKNVSDSPVSYLLVQGEGEIDFNKVNVNN